MSFRIESEIHPILKLTIDTTQKCNLLCKYCFQGKKNESFLSIQAITDIMVAAEKYGVAEIYLSGAETSLHPEFEQILESSHELKDTSVALVTNGTTLDYQKVELLRKSNINRVCLSLDGADATTHNSQRPNSYEKAWNGLQLLQDLNIPITIISVAHQENFQKIDELSEILAQKHLAEQHHIVAVSNSGMARKKFDEIRLHESDFHYLNSKIAKSYNHWQKMGLHVVFTSMYPATGVRETQTNQRQLSLFELSEQLKRSNLLIRHTGDVTLTAAMWSREIIQNVTTGNVNEGNAYSIITKSADMYNSSNIYQLPRQKEAKLKYGIGDNLISKMINIPVATIDEFDILSKKLPPEFIKHQSKAIIENPDRYRLLYIQNNIWCVFDKKLSHVTLLKQDEAKKLSDLL